MTHQSLPPEADPDAELIALGMQLETAWAREKLLDAARDIPDDAFDAAFDPSIPHEQGRLAKS